MIKEYLLCFLFPIGVIVFFGFGLHFLYEMDKVYQAYSIINFLISTLFLLFTPIIFQKTWNKIKNKPVEIETEEEIWKKKKIII